jgi:hypothetical protein
MDVIDGNRPVRRSSEMRMQASGHHANDFLVWPWLLDTGNPVHGLFDEVVGVECDDRFNSAAAATAVFLNK